MGCKIRDNSDETAVSPSLSDALLFMTVCIIGLPVEVQVKDGSIYSGIFHTACVEKDYGIVLKRAKMIKKGKSDTNLAVGVLIDTLVVLSGDLVQVFAKEIILMADETVGNVGSDDVGAVNGSAYLLECQESDPKAMRSAETALEFSAVEHNQINQTRVSVQNEYSTAACFTSTNSESDGYNNVNGGLDLKKAAAKFLGREEVVENEKEVKIHLPKVEKATFVPVDEGQVVKERSTGEKEDYDKESDTQDDDTIHVVQCLRSSSANCVAQLNSVDEKHVEVPSKMSADGASCGGPDHERPSSVTSDVISSDVSTSTTSVIVANSKSRADPATSLVGRGPPRNTVSNTSAKEFKLNPGAKTFSPSFAISRSAAPPPPTPTVANMAYIQSSPPVVPVVSVQSEVGINPFSSVPAKFVQYNNFVAGNGSTAPQYSQPIVAHVGSRPQPIRYAGQYHPIQAGPAYINPNSPAVMVGRFGQLVYVHPVSQDVVPGATSISQIPAHPLFTPQQSHFPKHQGTGAAQALQLSVTPPFMSGGHQPFAIPSHIPFSQPPFPAIRTISIPGANGVLNTKFP